MSWLALLDTEPSLTLSSLATVHELVGLTAHAQTESGSWVGEVIEYVQRVCVSSLTIRTCATAISCLGSSPNSCLLCGTCTKQARQAGRQTVSSHLLGHPCLRQLFALSGLVHTREHIFVGGFQTILVHKLLRKGQGQEQGHPRLRHTSASHPDVGWETCTTQTC